jgi:subfamily B ATP-binding cassette protein MsbA
MAAVFVSLLFFYRSLNSLMSLQEGWNKYLEVSGSLENIQSFQRELHAAAEPVGNQTFKTFDKVIKLENVSFGYSNKQILNKISFEIYKNETLAFVGESGSGKTTLVNVLCGLLPPDDGIIQVDNYLLKQLYLPSFQKRIGYITQEPVIFNDTLFNNISLWDEPTESNYQRYSDALRQASLHSLVDSLPVGADTLLGQNGINLSGGQRQRISIARELYKNIDILIMDEATSALDSETERDIQESIQALKGKYTILMVAHRLSTIKSADRIIIMKDGTIRGMGSYEDLIRSNHYFANVVTLQNTLT